MFNSIWQSGVFSPFWREATIVAIQKPGKDSSDPNNYRPIALLMQNNGEDGEQLIDVGLRIQSFIGLGGMRFLGKTITLQITLFVLIVTEHVIGIFFDLEKAVEIRYAI